MPGASPAHQCACSSPSRSLQPAGLGASPAHQRTHSSCSRASQAATLGASHAHQYVTTFVAQEGIPLECLVLVTRGDGTAGPYRMPSTKGPTVYTEANTESQTKRGYRRNILQTQDDGISEKELRKMEIGNLPATEFTVTATGRSLRRVDEVRENGNKEKT